MDWTNIISAAIAAIVTIIVGVPVFIKYFFNKMIDNHFARALEDHKHKLQSLSEQSRFDYQRKLQDFNLYTTKKHEHYIDLYNVLIKAHGSVSYLASPIKMYSSYDWYNEDDLREYLIRLETPKGRTEELVQLWRNNKNAGTEELREHVMCVEEWRAERDVSILQNTYWGIQIYLSKELKELLRSLISDLRTLSINSKREFQPVRGNLSGKEYKTLYEENKKLQKSIDEKMEVIIVKMQNELSVGYY